MFEIFRVAIQCTVNSFIYNIRVMLLYSHTHAISPLQFFFSLTNYYYRSAHLYYWIFYILFFHHRPGRTNILLLSEFIIIYYRLGSGFILLYSSPPLHTENQFYKIKQIWMNSKMLQVSNQMPI